MILPKIAFLSLLLAIVGANDLKEAIRIKVDQEWYPAHWKNNVVHPIVFESECSMSLTIVSTTKDAKLDFSVNDGEGRLAVKPSSYSREVGCSKWASYQYRCADVSFDLPAGQYRLQGSSNVGSGNFGIRVDSVHCPSKDKSAEESDGKPTPAASSVETVAMQGGTSVELKADGKWRVYRRFDGNTGNKQNADSFMLPAGFVGRMTVLHYDCDSTPSFQYSNNQKVASEWRSKPNSACPLKSRRPGLNNSLSPLADHNLGSWFSHVLHHAASNSTASRTVNILGSHLKDSHSAIYAIKADQVPAGERSKALHQGMPRYETLKVPKKADSQGKGANVTDTTYYLTLDPFNRCEAQAICETLGANLATIDIENFLPLASFLFNNLGARANAWIDEWNGNFYNGQCLCMATGNQAGGGAINAPNCCNISLPVLCSTDPLTHPLVTYNCTACSESCYCDSVGSCTLCNNGVCQGVEMCPVF